MRKSPFGILEEDYIDTNYRRREKEKEKENNLYKQIKFSPFIAYDREKEDQKIFELSQPLEPTKCSSPSPTPHQTEKKKKKRPKSASQAPTISSSGPTFSANSKFLRKIEALRASQQEIKEILNKLKVNDPKNIQFNPSNKSNGTPTPNISTEFLKSKRKNDKMKEQQFKDSLLQEREANLAYLTKCVEEVNDMMDILANKTYYFKILDHTTILKIEKTFNGNLEEFNEEDDLEKKSNKNFKKLNVYKFQQEHEEIVKEFRLNEKKKKEKEAISPTKLRSNSFFIANDAKEKSIEVNEEMIAKSRENYNALKKKKMILSKQQEILMNLDDSYVLILSQINEIEKRGWNPRFIIE